MVTDDEQDRDAAKDVDTLKAHGVRVPDQELA